MSYLWPVDKTFLKVLVDKINRNKTLTYGLKSLSRRSVCLAKWELNWLFSTSQSLGGRSINCFRVLTHLSSAIHWKILEYLLLTGTRTVKFEPCAKLKYAWRLIWITIVHFLVWNLLTSLHALMWRRSIVRWRFQNVCNKFKSFDCKNVWNISKHNRIIGYIFSVCISKKNMFVSPLIFFFFSSQYSFILTCWQALTHVLAEFAIKKYICRENCY